MAQLDNAADSDSEERGFESLWAGQKIDNLLLKIVDFTFSLLTLRFCWFNTYLVAHELNMCYYFKNGLVAQLGERTVRIRKVEGSTPFESTIEILSEPKRFGFGAFCSTSNL